MFVLPKRFKRRSLQTCVALLSGLIASSSSSLEQARADTSTSIRWEPIHALNSPPAVELPWDHVPPSDLMEQLSQAPIWEVLDAAQANQQIARDSTRVTWVVLEPAQEQQLEQTLQNDFASDPEPAGTTPQPEPLSVPSAEQLAQVRFRGVVKPSFHSASRSVVYGETMYPEMGFWIPSAFRQAKDYRFTFTGQLLGNPTNTKASDWCNWKDFWDRCSDGQFFAEVTPLIWGPSSVGVNFSQQESFLGDRSDGSFDQGGQAVGFQVKTNLSQNIGFGIVGLNLWNPFGKGGPNGSYPAPGEEIQADLGRTYLFLGSAAWDLGFWFGSDTPAILAVTAGVGNGRYKNIVDTQRYWVNYGPYSPIGVIALAFNEYVSIFAEYQGQYNGFGLSLKPLKEVPVTATLMFRDFQGTSAGIVNCQGGNPDNCRTTVDGRLTLNF